MAAQGAVEAIFAAARAGNVGEVARLLAAQPDLLEAKGWQFDCSLLMEAAEEGHIDVVRLLLERGANINGEDRFATTALFRAAGCGHAEVVALLLRAGARTTKRDGAGAGMWTALMTAAYTGQLGVARLLLQHMRGEGLDDRDRGGQTAVCYSCDYGHAEVLRALLLAGADHTLAANRGVTPRDKAAQPFQQGINSCAAVFEWWDGELERGYALHLARRVHEDSTTQQQAPGAPVPAYLRQRVKRKKRLPRVQVQGGRATRGSAKRSNEGTGGQPSEEEKDAMTKYVNQDLAPELYIELMEGFHK